MRVMALMGQHWWAGCCRLMRKLIRPCLKRLGLGVMLLTSAVVANNVTANDGRIERVDYLIADGAGFPDKLAQWQSFATGDGLGFVDRTVWLRLEFSSSVLNDENLWLLIRPIHLDHISVYRNSPTPIQRVELGDRTSAGKGALASGWTLPLSADDLKEGLLIGLESHNLMYPIIEVHSQSALIDQSMIFFAALSVAVAATLLYLLWAGVTWISAPTPLLAAFIARLIFYLLTLFVHSGLSIPFFGSDALVTQDLAHNTTALTYITLAQLFDFMLLREIGGRWAQRLFLGALVISSLLKFGALGLGEVSWSLQINNIAALTTLLLGLGGALFTRVPKISVYQVSSRMVAIYFLLQAIPLAAIMASGSFPYPARNCSNGGSLTSPSSRVLLLPGFFSADSSPSVDNARHLQRAAACCKPAQSQKRPDVRKWRRCCKCSLMRCARRLRPCGWLSTLISSIQKRLSAPLVRLTMH